jgi:AcrR family transcriptional regulator
VTGVETEAKVGLRERKKRRTRIAILDEAIRLFSVKGYEATTIAQIAEVVEVAPSTLFTYFPTKVEIVFSMLDAIIDDARTRILERAPGESAADAVISWIEEDVPEIEAPYSEMMRELPSIIDSSAELQAEQRLRLVRLDDILATAFAEDLDEPVDGVRARVLATIAVRGMSEIFANWHRQHRRDAQFDTHEVCRLKAEYLREALPAGLAAVETLPPIAPHTPR